MIIEQHVFNPKYSPDWQEKLFLPSPSLRNIKMVLNFLVAKIQCKLKMTRLFNYPYFVLIDPSSVCNLKCPLCPTGRGDNSRPPSILKFKNFKKIIDEIGDYTISVLFANWGEPLLNKQFSSMVEYTKKVKRVPFVSVESNMNVELSNQDTEKLINSGLDLICIAIDGTTQETYEKYRRGGSLEKVIENTKRLLEKRKKLGKDNPFVVWQFVVFKHNQHEIESVIELGRKIGVDVVRITAAEVSISGADKPFEYNYEIGKEYLPELGSKYSAYTKGGKKKLPNKSCQWLWKSVTITSDGSISPCCCVFSKKYDFGNMLKEKNFKAIWNNKKYQNARKIVNNPDYAKKLFGRGNICALCIVYGNWVG